MTALLALWQALYEPGSLIVIVSPSQRQSQEMFRSLMRFYAELGSNVPGVNSETLLRAEFTNGSRILALPGSERTVRG